MQEPKKIIEVLLFTSQGPLSAERLKEILGEDLKIIREAVSQLREDYERLNSPFKIEEIGGGFQISTTSAYAPWVKKMFEKERSSRFSSPTLETLAIIAYRQPVTRMDIESIRGVNVEGVLKRLLEADIVKILGKKKTVGRPMFYGTTRKFLEYFGLKSLDELPKLKEINNRLPEAPQDLTVKE